MSDTEHRPRSFSRETHHGQRWCHSGREHANAPPKHILCKLARARTGFRSAFPSIFSIVHTHIKYLVFFLVIVFVTRSVDPRANNPGRQKLRNLHVARQQAETKVCGHAACFYVFYDASDAGQFHLSIDCPKIAPRVANLVCRSDKSIYTPEPFPPSTLTPVDILTTQSYLFSCILTSNLFQNTSF